MSTVEKGEREREKRGHLKAFDDMLISGGKLRVHLIHISLEDEVMRVKLTL